MGCKGARRWQREGMATKWDRRMLDGNFKINLGKAERLYLKVRGGAGSNA